VQQFVKRYPQATVKLEYLHPAKVYDAVEEGQVDLGLVSYPKASRTTTALPWREETMVLVCSPQHHLADEPSVPLAAIDGQAMVGFDDGLQIRREIDRALANADVEANVVMQFDNIETIKRAVEINAGVSILPQPTIVREVAEGTLVAVPLEGINMVRPLGIIHRKGVDLGKSAQRFIELLCSDSDVRLTPPESNGRDHTAREHAKASA
jgi:DNA-binding transcriptional LysR family regulator